MAFGVPYHQPPDLSDPTHGGASAGFGSGLETPKSVAGARFGTYRAGVLSEDAREQFADDGYVRLAEFVPATEVAAMAAAVWQALGEKFNVEIADPSTWPSADRRTVNRELKGHIAFGGLADGEMAWVLDGLLGPGAWEPPRRWGGAMEVVFPGSSEAWTVPSKPWHLDWNYEVAPEPLVGVKVIILLDDISDHGRATLVISRSHHVVRGFVGGLSPEERADHRKTQRAFLRHHPWLAALTRESKANDRLGFMRETVDIAGSTVKVVALSGRAGDAYLVHPWVIHCPSPNTDLRPRLAYAENIQRRGTHTVSDVS